MADRPIAPALASTDLPSRAASKEAGVRRGVLAFVVTFVVGVSGIAAAGVLSGAGHDKSESNESEANEQEAGVHGGPIERFHQAGSCDLTAVSSLPGNWTHGDYVSTVAAAGDPAQIPIAAHSDCGKPMVSVGHGGGPPAHALANKAAGQAHAGGEADESGAEVSGS
jgi:hypothetical protein